MSRVQREVVTLHLHPKQMLVHLSKARYRVVVAGRRWGKTRLSMVELIKAAAKKKNQMVWYVAPTYKMAKQIMWNDLVSSIPKRWVRDVNQTSLSITLVNGSRIELKGADKPDSLRGVRLNFLVLDEFQDMQKEVWSQVLRPTLADTRGPAIFIGTPKAYNYLFEVYDKGQKQHNVRRNAWESWQFPTITSPFIPIAELEAAKEDMDPRSFRQEFEASFETMSGRVYYAFDRKLHVGRYPFNPNLPIWIGQDFNLNPMASVIMQPQPSGEIWIVDEVSLFNSNTAETMKEIEKRYWRHVNKIVVYPDAAGGQRQHARGETDLDIIRDVGFKAIKHRKKNPAVADRVNAVNRRWLTATGKIGMRVDEKCKNVIMSAEQTLYKEDTRDIDKAAGTEHWMDALGYAIELEFPVRKIDIGGWSR